MMFIIIMIMLTMRTGLWRDISHPICYRLAMVIAMSVDIDSCRNLRKILKALLFDSFISTYITNNDTKIKS